MSDYYYHSNLNSDSNSNSGSGSGFKSSRKMVDAAAYSSRVQEAMRHNKLGSAEYPLAMSLMNAVLNGYTEEQWKEQNRSLKALSERPTEKTIPHSDAANRYEQMVNNLKELMLWPFVSNVQ